MQIIISGYPVSMTGYFIGVKLGIERSEVVDQIYREKIKVIETIHSFQ
jgi:hypothetical protein